MTIYRNKKQALYTKLKNLLFVYTFHHNTYIGTSLNVLLTKLIILISGFGSTVIIESLTNIRYVDILMKRPIICNMKACFIFYRLLL